MPDRLSLCETNKRVSVKQMKEMPEENMPVEQLTSSTCTYAKRFTLSSIMYNGKWKFWKHKWK